jgi:hypothetical protein
LRRAHRVKFTSLQIHINIVGHASLCPPYDVLISTDGNGSGLLPAGQISYGVVVGVRDRFTKFQRPEGFFLRARSISVLGRRLAASFVRRQQSMSIAGLDSHLEAEAMISNRDIGFVSAGESAVIMSVVCKLRTEPWNILSSCSTSPV